MVHRGHHPIPQHIIQVQVQHNVIINVVQDILEMVLHVMYLQPQLHDHIVLSMVVL